MFRLFTSHLTGLSNNFSSSQTKLHTLLPFTMLFLIFLFYLSCILSGSNLSYYTHNYSSSSSIFFKMFKTIPVSWNNPSHTLTIPQVGTTLIALFILYTCALETFATYSLLQFFISFHLLCDLYIQISLLKQPSTHPKHYSPCYFILYTFRFKPSLTHSILHSHYFSVLQDLHYLYYLHKQPLPILKHFLIALQYSSCILSTVNSRWYTFLHPPSHSYYFHCLYCIFSAPKHTLTHSRLQLHNFSLLHDLYYSFRSSGVPLCTLTVH